MSSIEEFMESPLIVWVQTFCPPDETLAFPDILDGVFLNDVMLQIDPRPTKETINRNTLDVNGRIQNWQCLMNSIYSFYQESLQQLIIMKLPDVIMIAQEPDKNGALDEIIRLLKLILGCAVQCDHKEVFIDEIRKLDKETQQQLVEYIKEIRDFGTFMYDVDYEEMGDDTRDLFNHLKAMVKQRDELNEKNQELVQEREYYRSLVDKTVKQIILPAHMDKQHVQGELLHYKNQIKLLQEEIDEKNSSFVEMKATVDECDLNNSKLVSEKQKLIEELRQIGINRDELDVLQEQAYLAEEYETENFHLKAKVAELEFYKSRTEELREDNTALVDSRTRVEEQLEKSRKREESVIDELVQSQLLLEDITMQQENDKRKIQDLMETIAHLETEKLHLLNQNADKQNHRQTSPGYPGSDAICIDIGFQDRQTGSSCTTKRKRGGCSLSDEIHNQKMSAELLELKAENDALRRRLEDAEEAESAYMESKWRITELKREKLYYVRELEKLKNCVEHEKERIRQFEDKNCELLQSQERKEEEISMLKDMHEHKVETLEMEIKDLQKSCTVLRQRQDIDIDDCMRYVQQENIEMFMSVQDLTTRLNRMKYSNKVLQKSCDKLKEDVDRTAAFGGDNDRLRRENYDLRRQIAASKLAVELSDSYEKKNLKLEIENKKLSRLVDVLRTTLAQVDPRNRVSYHYVTSL
ncbi:protein Daple-like isoform X2 [Tubulanus polymorphus]|uniref:protein Daple-like isoform X2 n=1 Tax=Tubulanus polymorphus TaxID=672921 RepID=UPI003DA58596